MASYRCFIKLFFLVGIEIGINISTSYENICHESK
jgi:hypothetical protein